MRMLSGLLCLAAVIFLFAGSARKRDKPTYRELMQSFASPDSTPLIPRVVMRSYLPASVMKRYDRFYALDYCRTKRWTVFEIETRTVDMDSLFRLTLAFRDSLLDEYHFHYTERIEPAEKSGLCKVTAYCGIGGISRCSDSCINVQRISFSPYLTDTMNSGPFFLDWAKNVTYDSITYCDR